MNTGGIEITEIDGISFLKLIQINHDGSPKKIGLIEMPEVRPKKISTQSRWLKGSYLTPDQKAEEKYQVNNHIA
ncbi:MAG: hypothetical protein WC784_03225 [Candidatus Shapirobacteria bacterium]|jgi:hypothetical protein